MYNINKLFLFEYVYFIKKFTHQSIQSKSTINKILQKYFTYFTTERSLNRSKFNQSVKLCIDIEPNLFWNKRVKWIGNWRVFSSSFQILSLVIYQRFENCTCIWKLLVNWHRFINRENVHGWWMTKNMAIIQI